MTLQHALRHAPTVAFRPGHRGRYTYRPFASAITICGDDGDSDRRRSSLPPRAPLSLTPPTRPSTSHRSFHSTSTYGGRWNDFPSESLPASGIASSGNGESIAWRGLPVVTRAGFSSSTRRSTSSSSSSSLSSRAIPSELLSLPHDSPEVQDLIRKHANQSQTSASLRTLMKTGRGEFLHKMRDRGDISDSDSDEGESSEATERVLIQVAGFLRHELPIRLAHRIQDLERVPLLADVPSVRQVKDLYISSFLDLISKDKAITTYEQEREFAAVLEGIYERHSRVLVQMARGAFELRAAIRNGALLPGDSDDNGVRTSSDEMRVGRDAVEFEMMESTHAFLDRFYISRIGIRVLIGQYLSLRQPPVESYVGIICGRTSPYEIVKRAIDDAAFMCARKYGDAPEVIITGRLDMTFPYVPTHLHYIMLELIKNSMRATVEHHGVDAEFPPIKVVISDGTENEDVIIKISDEGGGIPRSNMKRIWSYLFTTADPEIQEGMVALNEDVDHSIDSPLAGLGYGLPISRSYARYFGGDLSIMSMEGFGTDAFVYLTRLGNTKEPLPI